MEVLEGERCAAPASSPEPTRTPPSSVSSPFLREDISLVGTSWPSSLVLALAPTSPHSAPPPVPTSSRHMPAQLHLALALSFSDPDATVARPISLSPGGNLAGQHELAFFSGSGSGSGPTPLHASPRARVIEGSLVLIHTRFAEKMAKRCQLLEQENENLNRDKHELQEKFAEKSRQKRKLDEMYDQLRNEYESVKCSALQPANNYLARPQPDLFAGMPNVMDGGDHLRQGSVDLPKTPGQRDEGWGPPPRQRHCTSGPFDLSTGSLAHAVAPPVDIRPRQQTRSVFRATLNNPSSTLRNLIISPVKCPRRPVIANTYSRNDLPFTHAYSNY
ncbi:E3 ubiquitin-protein ligase CCNB1IP1 homolog [Zea mays]|uniref:E3 ubiquitin-protein ligase CCNB1IP1 homolog n=1 Tax=Zea mays TaxID=4577 RepID=UPI0009AA9D8D|nr:E3 ubiquitin-protein ligase CCNB1IP1 homolog [Zea mays]|eukprot:XP_020398807.1 E3 ubiquitin-protein ligase CCNB1IP1 homolog [Zea mays]